MRVDRLLGEHGENHSGELHRETAEQKANRILSEELSRRGWPESDLAVRRRSDPGKLVIAVRLRNETTLPVKWIAARVQIGTAKGADFDWVGPKPAKASIMDFCTAGCERFPK